MRRSISLEVSNSSDLCQQLCRYCLDVIVIAANSRIEQQIKSTFQSISVFCRVIITGLNYNYVILIA